MSEKLPRVTANEVIKALEREVSPLPAKAEATRSTRTRKEEG